ncbi:MAG: hydroxyacylglutathione hydrolase, partial [Rhodobacterales bacterium]|nr:hydroxyacylglutathione hydrolase [Rhodobacterales bacterium]
MSLELITIPCLSDNYAFILFNNENRSALLVDAPEAEPI